MECESVLPFPRLSHNPSLDPGTSIISITLISDAVSKEQERRGRREQQAPADGQRNEVQPEKGVKDMAGHWVLLVDGDVSDDATPGKTGKKKKQGC